MKSIDHNIWVVETAFTLFGAHLGNRMTVIRLSNGDLFLHSPVKITEEITDAVKRLGNVAYLVTPNRFHGLFVDAWRARYPQAKHLTAKEVKENDINTFSLDTLGNEQLAEIEIIKIEGAPNVNEYAFLHKESGTLILTDIAFNIGADVPLWSKIFFKLNGSFNKFGPSRLMKAMISDPEALGSSVEKMLAFDLKRIIVSHGDIIQSNPRMAMKQAFCSGNASTLKKSKARFSFSSCG